MNTEQERAEFEAFASKHGLCVTEGGDLYRSHVVAWMWKAWQARAALQSQGREDAVGRLIEALKSYMHFGCPVCSGDCHSANPPVSGCPVREAQQAIDHARRIEGDEE